ncbi:site-specific DNA-methyltransferase [Glutamicibacter halophytocola]|nr:site-specific DNA-methyltransferase [Glutamicibacter halophytocola]
MKLELTWHNKDQALIPAAEGKYGYKWVSPKDPRYCETHVLELGDVIEGHKAPKDPKHTYSDRADLEPIADNLLILGESGDVLESLTRIPELSEKYVGQVKCVYIDPPFNTGQAFDHYEDNLEHSIWLTMMRDRLLHIRRLMSADGSIWVHLDDAEVHRMRSLLDEVFGPEKFVAEIIWQKSDSPRSDASEFSSDHDTILVYKRSDAFEVNRLERSAADDVRFTNPDSDPHGPWWDGDPTAPGASTHQGMVYAIQHPMTGELVYPGRGRCWSLGQPEVLEIMRGWAPYKLEDISDADERAARCGLDAKDVRRGVQAIMLAVPPEEARRAAEERYNAGQWPQFILRKGGAGGLGRKAYVSTKGSVPRTLWLNTDVGQNRTAKSEIKALFPNNAAFDTPKPERLLQRIIHIASNPGDTILDVFAGSGTTAAVAHKMGRRWVTCELLEDTFEKFTLPRLKKVVEGQDDGGVTVTSDEKYKQVLKSLNGALNIYPDLKEDKATKDFKKALRAKKEPDTINWLGGGAFQVARLAPACFDFDLDLGLTTLTDAAGDIELLTKSVAAQLGFKLTPKDTIFHGSKGSMRLYVTRNSLTPELATEIAASLGEGERVTIASTSVLDESRQALRQASRGSKVVHIPDDIFQIDGEDAF